jgi:hypothetical protein
MEKYAAGTQPRFAGPNWYRTDKNGNTVEYGYNVPTNCTQTGGVWYDAWVAKPSVISSGPLAGDETAALFNNCRQA